MYFDARVGIFRVGTKQIWYNTDLVVSKHYILMLELVYSELIQIQLVQNSWYTKVVFIYYNLMLQVIYFVPGL